MRTKRASLVSGSPPHMRGKGKGEQGQAAIIGITPAHAGKSKRSAARFRAAWDHPRTCGEKLPVLVEVSQVIGSPPHMRGKVANFKHCGDYLGITPAHAGKSDTVRYTMRVV